MQQQSRSWGQEKHGFAAHNREITPIHAVGKVPVSLGRECQQETARCWFVTSNDASGGVAVAGQSLLQHHSHAVSTHLRVLTERGSLSPCLQPRQTICAVRMLKFQPTRLFRIPLAPCIIFQRGRRFVSTLGAGEARLRSAQQGGHSHPCCGESPRVFGQRVPAGDRKMLVSSQAMMLQAELQWQASPFCSTTAMP